MPSLNHPTPAYSARQPGGSWSAESFKVTSDEIPKLNTLSVSGLIYNSGVVAVHKVFAYIEHFQADFDITDDVIAHEAKLSEIRQLIERWHGQRSQEPLPKEDCMTVAKRFEEEKMMEAT